MNAPPLQLAEPKAGMTAWLRMAFPIASADRHFTAAGRRDLEMPLLPS